MDSLREFSIPLRSLYNGLHSFQWKLDGGFFKNFEASPLDNGDFKVEAILDKQDDLSTIQLKIDGSYHSNCDRCLAEIDIPIHREHQLFVKTGTGISEDPDLVLISPDATELKMADILYDYICLSLPLSQVTDCEKLPKPPCNMEILKRIQNEQGLHSDTSVWESLKNLNKN
jgi:uncharacterized metal-binding protein YceD (DUF177 family)